MSSAEGKPDATSRRTLLLDIDTGSDGNSPQKQAQGLTQEEKDRNAILMSIADLGSARRGEITALDKGHPQPVNIAKLLQSRECEIPGSDAGKLAADNQSQLASWANFGNTDIARSAGNEELDNIGYGQCHRQAMSERLLYTGVLTLEDSYDDGPRHKPVPPPLPRPASKASGRASLAGLGGSGSTDLRTKGYRPLDPAVVAGEKDSRYVRDGLQATAKSKSKGKSKPNVRPYDSAFRVTRPSTDGRVFQKRPWPPKGLEHLLAAPPLADPSSFMAAVTKTLPTLKSPCQLATVQPSSDLAQAAVQGSSMPSMTIQGVSLASKAKNDECPIAKASRNELRAPNISPDDLTEGKPSPQDLISPDLESECSEKISSPVGLGIVGVETKPETLLITRTAKEVQLDVERIRNFLEKKEIDALVDYLEQALGIKSSNRMQERVLPNPFKSKEPSSADKADPKIASSKTPSSQAPPSTTGSKSLSESIWAPVGSKAQSTSGRAPLKANPGKGNVSEAFKPQTGTSFGAKGNKVGQARRSTTEDESTTIFGDVTALCRLPGLEASASMGMKGATGVKAEGNTTAKTKIKRTPAGPGYEALVREIEQAKKETSVSTRTSQCPVTQALRFAQSVSKDLDFGEGLSAGRRGGDDSDGSDDWEL